MLFCCLNWISYMFEADQGLFWSLNCSRPLRGSNEIDRRSRLGRSCLEGDANAGVATSRPHLFVLQPNSQCPSVDQEHVWCTLVSGHHHRNDQGRSKDHGSKGIVQSLSFQRVICCFPEIVRCFLSAGSVLVLRFVRRKSISARSEANLWRLLG